MPHSGEILGGAPNKKPPLLDCMQFDIGKLVTRWYHVTDAFLCSVGRNAHGAPVFALRTVKGSRSVIFDSFYNEAHRILYL
jgi:hypothetical protein